jgi:hypothetical protein
MDHEAGVVSSTFFLLEICIDTTLPSSLSSGCPQSKLERKLLEHTSLWIPPMMATSLCEVNAPLLKIERNHYSSSPYLLESLHRNCPRVHSETNNMDGAISYIVWSCFDCHVSGVNFLLIGMPTVGA